MITIFGFYKFKKLNLLRGKKSVLQNACIKHEVRGTIIISKEGLNGTISGKLKNVSFIKEKIKILFKIKNFNSENLSKSKFQPFYKSKIKIKNEVVPMGLNIFKKNGVVNCKIEEKESNDWKLIDGIDLIVHIFNPEKRKFYELEKMWSELMPKEKVII